MDEILSPPPTGDCAHEHLRDLMERSFGVMPTFMVAADPSRERTATMLRQKHFAERFDPATIPEIIELRKVKKPKVRLAMRRRRRLAKKIERFLNWSASFIRPAIDAALAQMMLYGRGELPLTATGIMMRVREQQRLERLAREKEFRNIFPQRNNRTADGELIETAEGSA